MNGTGNTFYNMNSETLLIVDSENRGNAIFYVGQVIKALYTNSLSYCVNLFSVLYVEQFILVQKNQEMQEVAFQNGDKKGSIGRLSTNEVIFFLLLITIKEDFF